MEKESIVKEYTRGNLTIVWKPGLCIHSGVCVKALPEVYRPKEKPWIRPELASEEALREQIARCPSGALTYRQATAEAKTAPGTEPVSVQVVPGGPLLVRGSITLDHGGETRTLEGRNALCRCGASSKKPFCDGTHKTLQFE